MLQIKPKQFTTKLLITVLFALFIGSLSINSTSNISLNVNPNPNITVVYAASTLGKDDNGFNNMVFDGLQRALITHPGMTLTEFEPIDQTTANSQIETAAASGTYDLIIGVGFGMRSQIKASAGNHPLEQFLLIDEQVSETNVAGYLFKHHEGSFLVGMLAAMVTNQSHIGFIGGLDISLINEFRYGYEQGAKYIDPAIVIDVSYVGSFGDPVTAKTQTGDMITNGADIIFQAAGRSGIGVINETRDSVNNGSLVYSIGVDSNQDNLAPGVVLTSMMKRMDIVVENNIQAIVDGNWSSGNFSVGLAENGVGITNMNNTLLEKYTKFGDTKTRWDVIQETIPLIIDGTIVVSSTSSPIPTTSTTPEFDPPETTTTATTTTDISIVSSISTQITIETTTEVVSGPTSTTTETTSSTLPLHPIFVVIPIVILPILRRRLRT